MSEKLEVLQIQCLLGGEEGIDSSDITPGFWVRLNDHLKEFLERERVEILAIIQMFVKDSSYKGASRELAVNRRGPTEENRVLNKSW